MFKATPMWRRNHWSCKEWEDKQWQTQRKMVIKNSRKEAIPELNICMTALLKQWHGLNFTMIVNTFTYYMWPILRIIYWENIFSSPSRQFQNECM